MHLTIFIIFMAVFGLVMQGMGKYYGRGKDDD